MENNESYFNRYEKIGDEIKFLTNSEIRITILRYLSDMSASMKDIYKATNLSYSSISSNIHKLESKGYLKHESVEYYLNNLAKIKLLNLLDFNKSADIINECIDLWSNHDLKNIPWDTLTDLDCLKGSYLIESTPTDIYRTHNAFKKILENSSSIKSIFPFLHPDYPLIFEDLLNKGVNINLLFVKNIAMNFIKSMDIKIIKAGLKNENFQVKSLNSHTNVLLTVTNNHMVLALFKDDGSYDQNRLLISNERNAIKWANEFFAKYEFTGKKLYL